MDLRALRYFVETVRHSSFTQAAGHLCVTQSTVSKMVRQLEDEVGQPLLIREGRGVRLTDAGRIVYEGGQEALAVVKRLTQDVADLGDLVRGEVTVGIPPMVNLFFPPLIKRFKERYPQIKLMAQEAGGQVIEQRVLAGELEVGVTVLPVPADSGLASTELGRFPICLVGTKASSWYGLPQPTLASLDREPLLMFSEDYALTKRLREGFARAGVSPVVVGQSGQWDFLLSLAMAGLGTALMPEPLLKRLRLPDDVVIRPLCEPEVTWRVGQVWVPDRHMSHAARAWLAVCAEGAALPLF